MLEAIRRGVIDALRDVDTVIYDTHFLPEEYEKFPHYGHSTPDHAIEICAASGVRRLVLYHHAPGHTDEDMDAIDERYRRLGGERGLEVVTARERMMLRIGQTTDPGVGA
jgi:ribonuclease BN (tRNA processing enzyme)